jgi:hypothetical protein
MSLVNNSKAVIIIFKKSLERARLDRKQQLIFVDKANFVDFIKESDIRISNHINTHLSNSNITATISRAATQKKLLLLCYSIQYLLCQFSIHLRVPVTINDYSPFKFWRHLDTNGIVVVVFVNRKLRRLLNARLCYIDCIYVG